MSEELLVKRRDATVELTLNRPAARNALSRRLIGNLTDELRRADMDPDTRSVILTGAPPAFCAGLDLREVAQSTPEQADRDAANLLTLFETLDQLSKPVIAAVAGPAVAGGAGLASLCDLVLCEPSASLGYPEIKRGLVAAIVMIYLRRLVGERHAKYLLLTGESVSAARALDMGLVTEVVPEPELLERARFYAAMFAGYPPEAVANTKLLLSNVRGTRHAEALHAARQLNAAMRLTGESRAGVARFLGKK
jgi:methylglutaconyl-CoA hydratase